MIILITGASHTGKTALAFVSFLWYHIENQILKKLLPSSRMLKAFVCTSLGL